MYVRVYSNTGSVGMSPHYLMLTWMSYCYAHQSHHYPRLSGQCHSLVSSGLHSLLMFFQLKSIQGIFYCKYAVTSIHHSNICFLFSTTCFIRMINLVLYFCFVCVFWSLIRFCQRNQTYSAHTQCLDQ